ncbi:MAG TPA: enoyl-CoA hydratase/isomerase family protein [Woeseiaceae bacterium]|nr:enoyl-CoA hydratase/isomerase family protein [Woeseiaceae bacterium]
MALVTLAVSESIALITLNRPDKLNAINRAMLDELEQALDTAEADDRVRAIVLCGEGRAFSAGFDLDSPVFDSGSTEAIREELTRDFNVIMRFWDCRKPTVAAVHGYCLGSSMEISAVCDVTVAAEDCRFGAPEVRYGSGIVCLVLPWIVGLKNAKELLLTGGNIDAARALSIGLVNRVVPAGELRGAAEALARDIAANDGQAVRLTREAINRGFETAGLRRALAQALEYDIRIETTETPESAAFRKDMEADGLKAALARRAAHTRKQG